MRAIPAAVETLLKSRAQAGANAHNHLITLTGAPSGTSLLDPTSWTVWREFTTHGKGNGNIAETVDGRCIVAYCEEGGVYLAYAPTVVGILNGTEAFDYESAVHLFDNPYSDADIGCSINLVDGKLLMAIVYCGTNGDTGDSWNPHKLYADFWKDTDGNGTGMAFVSNVISDLIVQADAHTPSYVNKLEPSGDYVFGHVYTHDYGHYGKMHHSHDDGATWATIEDPTPYYLGHQVSARFMQFENDDFLSMTVANDGDELLKYFTDSGAVVATNDPLWDGWPNNCPSHSSWIEVNNKIYMAWRDPASTTLHLSRLSDAQMPPVYDSDFVKFENWTEIATLSGVQVQLGLTLGTSALIMQGSNDDHVMGAGTTVTTTTIRAKRIEINRNKGMASSATVVFDNKGGIYSPDKGVGADWKNIMFLNVGIAIDQGYGTELIRTFTGTIDDVVMTTFPAEISLICRDYLKRAYDQLITSDGVHTITYANYTPEAMFTALAGLAGWAAGDIHTEVTGLTIVEKVFQNETYGDAFSWLADMCGFMVFCDEDGDIYFVKDDDDDPPVSDYAFSEGDDIISLGYTISDRDLYNKIICIGDGVSYEVTYYNTYNILAGKKMLINANEATTEAQCQAIAEQARYVMNSRARICGFAAVCNPYLQIGDTLTVTETTTLISELYKITDISTSQSPDGGYLMHITCYHYAPAATS